MAIFDTDFGYMIPLAESTSGPISTGCPKNLFGQDVSRCVDFTFLTTKCLDFILMVRPLRLRLLDDGIRGIFRSGDRDFL